MAISDATSPYLRRNNPPPLHNYADVTNSQDALGQLLPQTLILQDLIALYHLFEGTGTTVTDSAPKSPNNGTINGTVNTDWQWAQGPVTKVLEFLGAAGYVDCTNVSDVTKGGTNSKFSIGGWFSPFAYGSDQNYLIARDGQYFLQQYGNNGQVRFGVHIGGNWIYLTSSDNFVAPLNSRCFAIGAYDSVNMYLYVANPLAINQLIVYTQAQTSTLDASSNHTYIGAKTSGGGALNGAVSECMIWARCLSSQEALELFFRPLFRIVGANVTLTGNAPPGDVIAGDTFYNNTPTKQTGTLACTGNAQPSDVTSGQTFYNTDPRTKLTGTYVNPRAVNLQVLVIDSGPLYNYNLVALRCTVIDIKGI